MAAEVFERNSIELVGIAVKTLTYSYIREALGSYVGRDTMRSKEGLSPFTSVIPGKCREISIMPPQIHCKSFPININPSSYSSQLYSLVTEKGYFLLNESASIENNDVGDRMLNEYVAVVGMRIGRGNRVIGEDLPQCNVIHYKSHMTWN
jgi:hypothetical protein